MRSIGTTSACAENTIARNRRPPMHGNYLRVRGEYVHRHGHHGDQRELPPRARRILNNLLHWNLSLGTTSACAENTACFLVMRAPTRNYLRVRGEYEPPQHIHPQN